ncbi:MAG: hypothetical protein WCI11_15525 [Candidatus Methylumidiphilus sp.]
MSKSSFGVLASRIEIEAMGKAEPRYRATAPGKAGTIGKANAERSHWRGPPRSTRAGPMPSAPRAGLDDLAQVFQPSSPFGQAGGVLPLAVWLEGDFFKNFFETDKLIDRLKTSKSRATTLL